MRIHGYKLLQEKQINPKKPKPFVWVINLK